MSPSATYSECWKLDIGNWIKLYLSNGDIKEGIIVKYWLNAESTLLNITIDDSSTGETLLINGRNINGYLTGPPK